jgi:hypothetical protein
MKIYFRLALIIMRQMIIYRIDPPPSPLTQGIWRSGEFHNNRLETQIPCSISRAPTSQ